MLSSVTEVEILQQAQNALLNLRRALQQCADLYAFTSGVPTADLEALGFTPADTAAVLSGIADANALASLYETGSLPDSYTLPYVFGASQRVVIGPQ